MATEIPKDQLKLGQWYFGEWQLGPHAKWTGKLCVPPPYSMGYWTLDEMQYRPRGFSLFSEFGEHWYRT